MKKKLILLAFFGLFLAAQGSFAQDNEGGLEYELCPGRGERCAFVEKEIRLFGGKLFTARFWMKKTKSGPGIIMKK